MENKVKKEVEKKEKITKEVKKISEEQIMERLKEIAKLEMPLKLNKELRKLKEECNYSLQALQKQLNFIRKGIKKSSVTLVTDVTEITDVTLVTKPSVTFVTRNKPLESVIFGDSNLGQIMKVILEAKDSNFMLSRSEIAIKTGKSEGNIRNVISQNNEYLTSIRKDGKKYVTLVTEKALQELQQKIDQIKVEREENEEKARKEEEAKVVHKSKTEELLIESKNYFDLNKKELGEGLRKGNNVIYLDFLKLTEFSNILSDEILSNPEETLSIIEQGIEQSGLVESCRVRIKNIPKLNNLLIEDIRSKHLNEFISIKGKIILTSDVRPQAVDAKFECPSCLPKGTLIQTYYGLQKIEEVNKILSVDKDLKLVEKKAKIIKTGKKKIWKINKNIMASGEHKWFIYRNGMTQVIQTKDLKIGDVLYKLYDNKLCNMQKEDSKGIIKNEKENLLLELSEENGELYSNWKREKYCKCEKSNKIIQGRKINSSNRENNECFCKINKKEINKIWHKDENYFRAMQDKCKKFKYLQAWKEMWGKRISKISKGELSNDLYDLWVEERQNKKSINTSQRWESLQQQIRELNDSLQFLPYEITHIDETEEEVEMYDIQVPDTNNFILEDGVVTHNCGTIISVLQIEKKFREPSRCSCGRRGAFKLISKNMVDTARVIIQDLPELSESSDSKKLNCFVKEDLTSGEIFNKLLKSGNDILVNGVLKEVPVPLPRGGLSTRFELALEVNNVEIAEEEIDLDKLSDEEKEDFEKLANRIDEKGIKELTPSFAPVVIGHEYEKQTLCLYPCNQLNRPGIDEERNKSNALFIGDPSTAKSVLARFLFDISIGAKKVVGGSSSAVGITGAAIKDEFLGGWMINPGALPLAKDLLFLEEMNTMDDEEKAKIQDAMESQYVDITKANANGTFKVRAGIVACANPSGGHFQGSYDMKEIVKQFNIPSPILSRFDTIFLFRDIRNKDNDYKISLSMRKRRRKLLKPEFDKKFLKKFFFYTRKRKEPEMTEEFEILASKVYAKLREMSSKDSNITSRVSEAIDRMSIASAKLRGSEFIEDKDLRRVINIISNSYLSTVDYKTIKENLDLEEEDNNPQLIQEKLRELENTLGKVIPLEEIYMELDKKISKEEINKTLTKLINQGFLFTPRKDYYQLL